MLIFQTCPMPGTILEPSSGMPELPSTSQLRRQTSPRTFPNRMIQTKLRVQIVDMISPTAVRPTMETVKKLIEKTIEDRNKVKEIDGFASPQDRLRNYRLTPHAKVAVRKMMSRYWENYSPFALDLCGAVTRQGIFIDKMYKIDWLHSPSASSTMARLVEKHRRFFKIMADHPRKVAVPTLDVDLAWHTHQLSPKAYFDYSNKVCGRFVDHDDKIEEDKLATAFEWTSKVYQEQYGEIYSECTCWYCESECRSSQMRWIITDRRSHPSWTQLFCRQGFWGIQARET